MSKNSIYIIFSLFFLFFSQVISVYAQGLNRTPSCTNQGIIITVNAPASGLTDQPGIILGHGRAFGVNV
ncbi:MAG: hypothetical protein CEO21_228, partial [Microgenomates group bacterium Gr01-1014_80]